MEVEGVKVEEFLDELLGFSKPWKIVKVEHNKEDETVTVYLNYPRGTKFICPECGKECSVYDSRYRVVRHLDLWQHKTYIKAKVPRIKCSCGSKKNNIFTLLQNQ